MSGLVTEGLPDQVATSLKTLVPGTLKMAVVTGGAANAALTLTGIKPEDAIVGAVAVGKEGKASELSLAALPTISANDTIKTSTATTEGKLIVLWEDKQ